MIAVKRLEIVVESVEKQRVIELLSAAGVNGYTIYDNVEGSGQRGERGHVAFGEKFENIAFVVACSAAQVDAIQEELREILKTYGGMCLVSDALWLKHNNEQ